MRTSRSVLTAGAIVAVLAIALIIGFQLRDRNTTAANPSASPTPALTSVPNVVPPSPTANPNVTPTPASTASPASGAIYNDDFGFVVQGGDGPPHAAIRKESNNERIASVTTVAFAVSPDGEQIAYWTLASRPELHVFTVRDGTERTLATLTTDQRGGGVAWSSDNAAVLYSTESGSFGIGAGSNTNNATLNIWELTVNGRHGTTIDSQTNTGWLYRPLAWDRSTNVVAAGLTGEGGFMGMYVTVRINSDGSFTVGRVDTASRGMLMPSIHASTDAKLMLGVTLGSGDINWWPIDNYGAFKSQAGAGKRGAQWRPGTHEIGFIGPSDQFWLGDVDKAGALGLCCTAFSGVPPTSTLATFRADGAAVVFGVAAARPYGADYTLVRLGSDPKATSGDRVTFEDLLALTASVRFR